MKPMTFLAVAAGVVLAAAACLVAYGVGEDDGRRAAIESNQKPAGGYQIPEAPAFGRAPGFFGVSTAPYHPSALRVTFVFPESPALKAGIEVGDIIHDVLDPFNTPATGDQLGVIVSKSFVGSTVRVKVERPGVGTRWLAAVLDDRTKFDLAMKTHAASTSNDGYTFDDLHDALSILSLLAG